MKYPKIDTMFKRDDKGNIIEGEWSCPEFEYLADNRWMFTEKIDGTNIRVLIEPNGGIGFAGRTDKATIPSYLKESLKNLFLPKKNSLLTQFPDGAILYGEGYGTKIQKDGGRYRDDCSFILFDIKIGGWWLRYSDIIDIAFPLGIDVVPIIGNGSLYDGITMIKNGITSITAQDKTLIIEGLVAKPAIEMRNRTGKRIMTKIKTRDFNSTC